MDPEQLTIAGLLIATIAAGARGLWVFGWVYQAALAEVKFWRDRALEDISLAEMATDEAEKRAR